MDNREKQYYIQFGEWLIEEEKIPKSLKENFRSLRRNFYGGGSPTLAILKAHEAREPEDSVETLKVFAKIKNFRLLDTILEKNGIDKDSSMRDLSQRVRIEIARILDHYDAVIENWVSFASYLGFDDDEINNFRRQQIVPGRFSPTKELFDILKSQNKLLPAELIIEWGKSIDLDEISVAVDDFIKKERKQQGIAQNKDYDEMTATTMVLLKKCEVEECQEFK